MANQHSGMKMIGDINLNGNQIYNGTGTELAGPQILVTDAYTAGATGTIGSIDIPANSVANQGDTILISAVVHCTDGSGATLDLRVGSTTVAQEADADLGEVIQLDAYVVVSTTNATANFASGKVLTPALDVSAPITNLGYDVTAAKTVSLVSSAGTYTVAYFQVQRIV